MSAPPAPALSTSATTWCGRWARPPASRCSGRTARRCRSGRPTSRACSPSRCRRASANLLQDILVTGLVNGGVYALLAVGFSLIFGVARIVNIAHTAFYMLAAYSFYALLTQVGLGFAASALISIGGVTVLSLVCYRLVIEPVREHG